MSDKQGCKFTPNHGRCCVDLQTHEFHSSNMDMEIIKEILCLPENLVIHTAAMVFVAQIQGRIKILYCRDGVLENFGNP